MSSHCLTIIRTLILSQDDRKIFSKLGLRSYNGRHFSSSWWINKCIMSLLLLFIQHWLLASFPHNSSVAIIIIIIIIIRTRSRQRTVALSISFTIISRCPDLFAVRCTSLRTPRSQLLLGLPGFLLQSGTDLVPASSSTDTCMASCAGAPSGRRLTCPKRASLLSPMSVLNVYHADRSFQQLMSLSRTLTTGYQECDADTACERLATVISAIFCKCLGLLFVMSSILFCRWTLIL